jgi:hypothetical protein
MTSASLTKHPRHLFRLLRATWTRTSHNLDKIWTVGIISDAQWSYHGHAGHKQLLARQARRAEAKKAAKLAALPVKTPEEIQAEAEEKLQKHREYQRKYQREWQRKRKGMKAIDNIEHEKVI